MPDQLVEFLRSKRDQTQAPGVDWEEKRKAWIASVEDLYQRVKDLLRVSIDSGVVTIRPFDLEITEEFVGTYTIPALELTVGSERVEFRPMGVTVLGAAGRVDIRGERSVVTLLKDAAQQDGWTMVLSRLPRFKTEPFNRETLGYALEQVMLPLS